MLFAHWMLLVASVLPILTIAFVKALGGYDNSRPRAFAENLDKNSLQQRMVWAQANGWEALMMFAPAVLLATFFQVPAATLNLLAGVFIIARIAYVFVYAKDWSNVRSLTWFVGFACIIGLYLAVAEM